MQHLCQTYPRVQVQVLDAAAVVAADPLAAALSVQLPLAGLLAVRWLAKRRIEQGAWGNDVGCMPLARGRAALAPDAAAVLLEGGAEVLKVCVWAAHAHRALLGLHALPRVGRGGGRGRVGEGVGADQACLAMRPDRGA